MKHPAGPEIAPPATAAFVREDRSIGISAAAAALLCSALWGATVVAIRISLRDLPPIGLAGLRFALGFLFMLAWCRWQGSPLTVRPGQWVPIVMAGVILFAQIALLNLGTQHTNAAHGTIFINTHPIFVAVLAHFLLSGDQLTRRKSAGLVAAMAGVVLVVHAALDAGAPTSAGTADVAATAPDPPGLVGDLLVLASGFLLGVKTVYVKRALRIVEPGTLLLWHELVGVVLFFGASLAIEDVDSFRFTTAAVLALLYQGLVVAGFCFALWTTLLRHHRASQLAAFGFTTPLFGLVLSYLILGDRISPALLLGSVAVAAGIYLVTTAGRRET